MARLLVLSLLLLYIFSTSRLRCQPSLFSIIPSFLPSFLPSFNPLVPARQLIDVHLHCHAINGTNAVQQGRAKDNDTPFSVRDTAEGIRVLIGDETKDDSQWDGVLDLSWGVEPYPFFRVDRIDVNEGRWGGGVIKACAWGGGEVLWDGWRSMAAS